jgi:hypothetical protein
MTSFAIPSGTAIAIVSESIYYPNFSLLNPKLEIDLKKLKLFYTELITINMLSLHSSSRKIRIAPIV